MPLQEILSKTQGDTELGAVVLFSDGLNNHGRSVLDVANEYRARGIPVNVIGGGKELGSWRCSGFLSGP